MERTDQILTITADVEGMMRAKGYTDHYAEAFADGFHEGAIWADANPHWHKYPNEKPEKKEGSEWSKVVLVICREMDLPIKAEFHHAVKDGFVDLSVEYWYSKELAHHIDKEDILFWMELPQPPKFD